MAGGRFSVEAIFKAKDRITAPVSRMQNRVGKFTRAATAGFQKLNRSVDKVSAGIKKAAQVTAVSAVLIAGAMAPVFAAGADFEQAITNVGAVGLKTRAEIAPLEQMALELGRTTQFTATQAANAMEILARAGFSNNDILKATPGLLSAAAASGLEIAEVADHVSNALKGMGLETDQAARVADVLALASSKTNSSIGTLGESLSNVASTARQLKIPFEDTVAAIALMQDVGLDASVAGSAFNTMLTQMAAPTVAMQKKMRRFGISFKDAKGNMLPLQKVLEQLSIAGKKAGGNFDKVAFLAELVGLRGQKAASNLADLFETGKVGELTKQLENARGSAEKMAKLRMNTVRGSMLLLGSAIDAVKVKIFDLNGGALKGLIDRTTEWVNLHGEEYANKIGSALGRLIDNLPTIVKWLERIGVALAVFYAFAAAVKAITVAMTALNIVMSLNPLGLVILGVTALIAAFVYLGKVVYDNWDSITSFMSSAWDTTVSGISASVDWIMGKIMKTVEVFKRLASGDFSGSWESFKEFFGAGDEQGSAPSPQMVSPQERTARSIEEKNSFNMTEVTIKDETGRAEVTAGSLGPGLELLSTGAF